MQILQHVRTQQHRFLALRIALFDAPRALLGQFVKTRVETFARLRNERPAQLFEARAEDFCPREFAAGAGKFLYRCGYRLFAALALSPANYRKLLQLQAPCSVRSCFFVKGKRRADKQWPGTALRQKSEFFRSVSWQLCRHVVCKFPFFAFGEHYAATQRLDAVTTKNFR